MTGVDLDADPTSPHNGMGIIPRAIATIFARAAALNTPPVPVPSPGIPPQQGTVRTADEMEGVEDGGPPAKRQKVAKLPPGQYYPEADWINMHPVRLSLSRPPCSIS